MISDRLLFSKWRKFLLLRSNDLKVIHHSLMILSHSSFLLKSHNNLPGYKGIRLNFFVSLSTTAWRCYSFLGQSQNSMVLSEWLLKNVWSSLDIAIVCCWCGCMKESMFFSYMNSVCNDYDAGNILCLNCLINPTSDGEWFCLCWCNVNNMMKHLQRIIEGMDISNKGSNIVFDTCISDNDDWFWIW